MISFLSVEIVIVNLRGEMHTWLYTVSLQTQPVLASYTPIVECGNIKLTCSTMCEYET